MLQTIFADLVIFEPWLSPEDYPISGPVTRNVPGPGR
jgi:hypothetical protein